MADPGSSASKPHSAKCKVSKVPAGNTSKRPHQGSSHYEVFPDLRRQNYISNFKNATTGKTKQLSQQDAIDLGEGASNPPPVVKRTVSRAVSLRNSSATPTKSRDMDSESPLQRAKSCTPSSAHMKDVAQNESLQSSNGLKGNYSKGQRQNSRSILRAPLKEQKQMEQAQSARWDANETRLVLGKSAQSKSFAMDKEKSPNKGKSLLGFPSVLDKGKSTIGVPSAANNHGQRSVRIGSVVTRGIELQQATVPVKCNEILSAAASWSGSCRVYNASQHLESIHKFQAHPLSRVHKKVYEFSKSMPGLLQFELTPRCNIWVDIDQHLCRDKRDIGLYFFPANNERWDKYDRLLEVMQEKDYGMRASVQDMELLIFTSIVLSSNYHQWGGRHFLWGLFRKVYRPLMELKKNQLLIDVEMEEEVDMTEDMNIDMVGGEEIPGRKDSVPPPLPSLHVPSPVLHARPLHVSPPARPQYMPPPSPSPPVPPLPPVVHARPLHVPPPAPLQHDSPQPPSLPMPPLPPVLHVPPPAPPRYVPSPPLKRVKTEVKEDYPFPPPPLYVPPPPPGPRSPLRVPSPPPDPLRRVKMEGFPDCPPGF